MIDKETLLGFLLLPLLLPTPPFKSKKPGDRYDPTKDFIQKSFILYAETDAEKTNFMVEKKKFYAYHKLPHQPYIVVYETNNGMISSVRINDVIYNLRTPELPIDCCIKICYNLDAEFPKECEHVWYFVAQYIYDLPVSKKVSSVISLINDLKIMSCN